MAFLLAFLQFGSAGMLAWGVAAAFPILIHLWSRRRYRQQSWAAMAFLLAALQKNARRIQLEHWILLAVRTAILLLFALALADPQLSSLPSWAGSTTGGQTHIALVLDGSYSMDYRQADTSRFEAAKELAKQLVFAGRQGDGYTLIVMAEPPRVVIAQPAFDKDDVAQEIDNLQLVHGGATLSTALAEIETMLRRALERHPRLINHRVCIFSDLQQTTWGEVASADCRARLGRIETLASLELVDLGQPGESNLAVARLEVDSATGSLVAAGSAAQIQADIQSFAREDRLRQPVEVFVDGQRIADERVDCFAGGRSTISVAYQFEAPGEHVVEVHMRDDSLPLDNRRWLSVPVRDVIRVLCVGGRPGESMHLALALAPNKDAAHSIQVLEAPESRLLDGDLAEFDCVFACNIGRFSTREAAALYRFASRGGGLIVFLGDQVQPESYNQLLAEDPSSSVLPGRLIDLAPTRTYSLDPLDYRHAIVAPFRGFPESGLLTTPVWKYFRIKPLDGAKPVLAFDSSDAAIIERQVGRGRCILVTTSASPDSLDQSTDPPTPWTALPTWPSFPPLVHEMLRASLAGRDEGRNLLVGDQLSGSVAPSAAIDAVSLSGPGDISERLPVRIVNEDLAWSYSPTIFSGVYEARMGTSSRRFAVNINPREADLARIDPQLLPSQFHREPLDATQETVVVNGAHGASYFRWLLGAVIGLLILEPGLAWRFGRGRA